MYYNNFAEVLCECTQDRTYAELWQCFIDRFVYCNRRTEILLDQCYPI